jgi:hypothetical protein
MSLREHGIIHLKVDNNPGPERKQTKESAEWHRQWMRQLRKSAREMEAQEAKRATASSATAQPATPKKTADLETPAPLETT